MGIGVEDEDNFSFTNKVVKFKKYSTSLEEFDENDTLLMVLTYC